MTIDINHVRVRIENVEHGYYGDVSFSVVIEALDLDTNRFVVIKTTEENI